MSKEWDEEDDTENVENEAETPAQSEAVAESQEAEPAAAPNEEQETIENIENFIEGTTKEKPEQQGGKAKEEWVTVIFGEDGKQISTQDKQKEKSVYDMEDEDFSATKVRKNFLRKFFIRANLKECCQI